jgi:RNA polymerase sigma-70 factor (ECF subfamily)
MARIRARDPAGLKALVVRYERRLLRLATGCLVDPGEALEAVQDSFLAAWEHIGRFREGADPEAWLVAICLNRCRDRLRARSRRPAAPLPEVLAAPAVPDTQEAAESRDRILAEVAALSEREREAFLLVVVEGFDSAQAGQALGCSAGAVRMALGRARRTLAGRLRAAGIRP